MALVLVAAQLLCAPPVASALADLATAGSDTAHCADGMPAGHGSDQCPCCPDDAMNAASCLSACTASVGWVATLDFAAAPAAAQPAPPMTAVPLATLAYPPLDPPPIV